MILAVDIEGSTRRNNRVKRNYVMSFTGSSGEALRVTGIGSQHYHYPFTDRGDGFLVLLRPVDEIPKRLLLSHLIPALARLLAAYNSSISPADQPRILRLRAVIHAGEVLYDGKGFFGEDLDVAFRLLDAPGSRPSSRAQRCRSPWSHRTTSTSRSSSTATRASTTRNISRW